MQYFKIFFCSLILVTAASCKKEFLDVPDKTKILRQAYITDLATAEHYLNGIYINLSENYFHGNQVLYPEIVADNIKPINNDFIDHYMWVQKANDEALTRINTTSTNLNGSWACGYKIARDCSFIINEIEKYKDQDVSKANDMTGQALTMRALVHFYLLNQFAQPYALTGDGSHAGIPYITSPDISVAVSRQTVNECYRLMSEDLNQAIRMLNPDQQNRVILNVHAARALLGRVYLYEEKYEEAKQISVEVTKNIPLLTGADFPSKLFTPDESEAIFQIMPSWKGVAGAAGSYNTLFAGFYMKDPVLQFCATADIADILNEDANDTRKNWVEFNGTQWIINKFPVEVIAGFPLPALSYYQTVLRSSEMYLTAAESYARLNREDSARYYLDAIRTRANASALPSSATGQMLLDTIYKERRKELCFEGIRMYDVLRQKKDVTRIDGPPAALVLPFGSTQAIAPIPEQDVQLSGLQQNDGY